VARRTSVLPLIVWIWAGFAHPAGAETAWTAEDAARWEQPKDRIAVSDDPNEAYATYLTPAYRKTGDVDLTWSMMATRWRGPGGNDASLDLTLGLRMTHPGDQPWIITGASLGSGAKIWPAIALKPLARCTDTCWSYEAGSIALPADTLLIEDADLSVVIHSRNGPDQAISFPKGIIDALKRQVPAVR
jgi:hypothetical protein